MYKEPLRRQFRKKQIDQLPPGGWGYIRMYPKSKGSLWVLAQRQTSQHTAAANGLFVQLAQKSNLTQSP